MPIFGVQHIPLTHERALEIQEEFLADDLPIEWQVMQFWTEAQCIAYYESGGAIAPDAKSMMKLSTTDIRQGAAFDGRLGKLLSDHLPPLGSAECGPPLCTPGAPADPRTISSGCFVSRPNARVRLFVLYGVADVTMSMQKWLINAPEWLEVRLVEYPGHGFRSTEPLPACAANNQSGLDEASLALQRQQLIDKLSAEIQSAAGSRPYALYGFSFGAVISYGITLKLSANGFPPLLLAVAARGAPHCATLNRATCELVASYGTDDILRWQGGMQSQVQTPFLAPDPQSLNESFALFSSLCQSSPLPTAPFSPQCSGDQSSFRTDSIPARMRSRAAELFRYGMLLGVAPSGEGKLSAALPKGTGVAATDIASMLNVVSHLPAPPKVQCAVLAVGSSADKVWPGSLVQRWQDVAKNSDTFYGVTLSGVEHKEVMVHKETMRLVAAEVGVQASKLV